MGAALSGVSTLDGKIAAEIEGHGQISADLLVCADGAQSPTRRRLLPQVQSDYAGYVAWRGLLDEANTPHELKSFFDDAFTFSEARSGGHILVYFIPGEGADSSPGKRRLNWVWYVAVNENVLNTLLVDRDGQAHHASLAQGTAPKATIDALIESASREVHPKLAELVAATPDPFLQTIVDVIVPEPCSDACAWSAMPLSWCDRIRQARRPRRLTMRLNLPLHSSVLAPRSMRDWALLNPRNSNTAGI